MDQTARLIQYIDMTTMEDYIIIYVLRRGYLTDLGVVSPYEVDAKEFKGEGRVAEARAFAEGKGYTV